MIITNKSIKNILEWSGKNLHSPEQRLILGATALATQPFIDLNNKAVDEDTRKTSVARTVAKVIAGTLVGVIVRQVGINYVRKYSQYTANIVNGLVTSVTPRKGSGFFVPLFVKPLKKGQKPIFPLPAEKLEKKFELYRKAMGTFVATVAMVGTNFLLDAPLTRYLTNVFQKSFVKNTPNDNQSSSKKGVDA